MNLPGARPSTIKAASVTSGFQARARSPARKSTSRPSPQDRLQREVRARSPSATAPRLSASFSNHSTRTAPSFAHSGSRSVFGFSPPSTIRRECDIIHLLRPGRRCPPAGLTQCIESGYHPNSARKAAPRRLVERKLGSPSLDVYSITKLHSFCQ